MASLTELLKQQGTYKPTEGSFASFLEQKSPTSPMPVEKAPVLNQEKTTDTSGTYQVKAGDTLSVIAQREGVPISSITGYRSGDPNLIYPGEILNIGGKVGADPYAQALGQELKPPATAKSVIGEQPSIVENLRAEIQTAQDNREKARADLEKARVNYFNEEYEKAGLGKTKERISELDNSIAEIRGQRDEAILTARRNPNISAGVLQGEIGKLTDYFNSTINNEINKRNSIAEEYNRGLDEIEKKVGHRTADLASQYGHWDSVIAQSTQNLASYEQALREELRDETLQDRWEKEMAQQKELAQLKTGGENVKLTPITRYNEWGDAIGTDWYNPYTGEKVK